MRILFLLLVSFPVFAQTPNTTPQPVTGLDSFLEVDIRLRGPVNTRGTFPTVKLITAETFKPWLANNYLLNWQCDNEKSNCQPVTNVTLQVFIKTPIGRLNVTRFTGLCGWTPTTCVLPPFASISAPPGQYYTFKYDRVKAEWAQPPAVAATPLVATTPTPPATVSVLAPNGTLTLNSDVWSFGPLMGPGGNALLRNGTHAALGYGVEYKAVAGTLYVRNLLNNWYSWTGTAWAASAAP